VSYHGSRRSNIPGDTLTDRDRSRSRRLCAVCGLRSVHERSCSCCRQRWAVCDGCQVALARLPEAAS
jgi:hypothetical protein